MSLTTPSSGKNEPETFRMRNSQSHVQPHDIAPAHPSEGGIVERPTTEQSHNELARNSGLAKPAPPMDIGGRI